LAVVDVRIMELTQKLDCKDLHGYVLTLPSSVLDQLYGHPATCLAVFRFVTGDLKQCIHAGDQVIVCIWLKLGGRLEFHGRYWFACKI